MREQPMHEQIVRGPLLIPKADGSVEFYADGVLASDENGILTFAGPVDALRDTGLWPVLAAKSDPSSSNTIVTGRRPVSRDDVRSSHGVVLPPLLDIHTHIPQHPIRGRFVEGIPDDAPGGKLLVGLQRNVFPTEARCSSADHAEKVVRQFLADTLAHGVVGGAAYMTPSVTATEIALSILPDSWSVGLVLMNQNCPENLRTDESNLEADFRRLARKFGSRLIVTDRFAVAVDSPLRMRSSLLAKELGLRTQTHLNEQAAEKQFVEQTLYPGYASYTDVYLKDGLLDHRCITAHCIQMTDVEWNILRDTAATIAHCPTSNLLLGSGVMPLDEVIRRGIPFALGTDVGASPTASMLAEMRRFLMVHESASDHATATRALHHSTRASADLLALGGQFGSLEIGSPMSFIEVSAEVVGETAEAVIRSLLPADPDHPPASVNRVTIRGTSIYDRSGQHA